MKNNAIKEFRAEIKESLKLTKDNYIYFSGILVLFIILLSISAGYFLPGLFIVLALFLVAPFLMALASYFVTPSKQPLEQKQRFFFRLVKQFFRLDSIRVMIPLRNLLYSLLIGALFLYLSTFGLLLYVIQNVPEASSIYNEFMNILNAGNAELALDFLNSNSDRFLEIIAGYDFYTTLITSLGFAFAFSYLLVKRFFFVFLHVNLFNKTRIKLDYMKQKYFNGQFRWEVFAKYNRLFVFPVFLGAFVLSGGAGIALYLLINNLAAQTAVLFATLIYVLILFAFFRYIIVIYLILFGRFMAINAGNIYRESINDIDITINNSSMSEQEKERLLEVRNLLEAQIRIYEMQKDLAKDQEAKTKEEPQKEEPHNDND